MKQAEMTPRAKGAHFVQFLVQKAHVILLNNTLSKNPRYLFRSSFL
jgi:hypothetical protein